MVSFKHPVCVGGTGRPPSELQLGMKVSLIPVILKVCFSMLRIVKPLISSLLLRGEAEQARAGPGTFRPPLAGSPGATFPQTAQMSLREANHSLGIWILNTVVAVKPWLWGVL